MKFLRAASDGGDPLSAQVATGGSRPSRRGKGAPAGPQHKFMGPKPLEEQASRTARPINPAGAPAPLDGKLVGVRRPLMGCGQKVGGHAQGGTLPSSLSKSRGGGLAAFATKAAAKIREVPLPLSPHRKCTSHKRWVGTSGYLTSSGNLPARRHSKEAEHLGPSKSFQNRLLPPSRLVRMIWASATAPAGLPQLPAVPSSRARPPRSGRTMTLVLDEHLEWGSVLGSVTRIRPATTIWRAVLVHFPKAPSFAGDTPR